MAKQTTPKPQGAIPAAPKLTRDPKLREDAIKALVGLGIRRKEAEQHVDAAAGNTLNELIQNALQSVGQSQQRPPISPGAAPGPIAPPPVPAQQQFQQPPGGRQAAPSAEQLQQLVRQPPPQPVALPEVSAVERLTRGANPVPPINFSLLPQGAPRSAAEPQPTGATMLPLAPVGIRAPSSASVPAIPPTAEAPAGPIAQTAPTPEAAMPPPAPVRKADVRLRVKQMKEQSTPAVTKAAPAPAAAKPTPVAAQEHPIIRTKEEWDKLKSGDHFVWTDGYLYRKD